MLLTFASDNAFENAKLETVQIPMPIPYSVQSLLNNFSRTFTSSEKVAIVNFCNTMTNNNLWDKITKLYMPCLCGTAAEAKINVASHFRNNYVAETDTFSAGYSHATLDTTMHGLYDDSTSMNYQTWGVTIGNTDFKADDFSYFQVNTSPMANCGMRTNFTTDGTDTVTGFFTGGYSAGNFANQCNNSGTTGTYCGASIDTIWSAPGGYGGYAGKYCIGIKSFSSTALSVMGVSGSNRMAGNNTASYASYAITSTGASTISGKYLKTPIYINFLVPHRWSNSTLAKSRTLSYAYGVGKSLTQAEMTTFYNALNTLCEYMGLNYGCLIRTSSGDLTSSDVIEFWHDGDSTDKYTAEIYSSNIRTAVPKGTYDVYKNSVKVLSDLVISDDCYITL